MVPRGLNTVVHSARRRGASASNLKDGGPFNYDFGVSFTPPVAGFSVIEAADLAEAIELVSRAPCAVAHGVVEVSPIKES